MNYQTVVTFDPNLKDAWFTDADTIGSAFAELCMGGVYVVTGAPVATAKVYLRGAIIHNAVDGTNYENTGTTASPVWSLMATGASGIIQLTGDVTAGPGSGSQVATIAASAVTNAKISATAAIAFSKLASLPSADILVGSAGNVATATAVSGNATISNTGIVSVTGLTIPSQAAGDILYFNGTSWIRLPIGTAGQVLTVNGGATAPIWA